MDDSQASINKSLPQIKFNPWLKPPEYTYSSTRTESDTKPLQGGLRTNFQTLIQEQTFRVVDLSESLSQTVFDATVITLAVQGDFDTLAKIAEAQTSSTVHQNKVFPLQSVVTVGQAYTAVDRISIVQAIRQRRLVKDPVKSLLDDENFALLESAIKLQLIVPTQAEIYQFIVLKQTRLILLSLASVPHSYHSTHPLLKNFDIIVSIIDLIADPDYTVEGLRIFRYIKSLDIEVLHLKKIKYMLLKITNPDTEDDCLTSHIGNPLMFSILITIFIDEIANVNTRFTNDFKALNAHFMRFGELLIEELSDISQLRAILAEKPFDSDTLLDLIALRPNKFRKLLNSRLVKELVKEMWSGGIELCLRLSEPSFVYSSFSTRGNIYETHKRVLECKTANCFQLRSWIYNCSIRHIFELMLNATMLIYLLNLTLKFNHAQRIVASPLNMRASDYEEASVIYNSSIDATDRVVFSYCIVTFAQFISLSALKMIVKSTYKLDPRLPCDLSIFLSIFLIRFRSFGQIDSGNNESPYEYLWALMLLGYCLKLLLFAVANETLGPIIRMVYATFYDSLRLLAVFGYVVLMAAVGFFSIFYSSPGYQSFTEANLTLVKAALGDLDFDSFVERKIAGQLLLGFWLVIASILLMNILIAVVSSRYTDMVPQADADYVSLLLVYLDGIAYSEEYGHLIIATTPMNIVTLPVALFSFIPRYKKAASHFILMFSYAPLFLIGVVGFVLCNIYWAFISYFINLLWILKESHITTRQKIEKAANWACFGSFYLAYLAAVSMPGFVRYLLKKEPAIKSKAFTEEDAKMAVMLLKAYVLSHPTEATLSWENLKVLIKSSSLQDSGKISAVSSLLLGTEKAKILTGSLEIEHKYSMLFLLRKFTNPLNQLLNLKYTISILESKPFSFLETFSMHEALRAGSKMNEESQSIMQITL